MGILSRSHLILGLGVALAANAWGASVFTNQGSIVNTRHNLSQSSAPSVQSAMDGSRNDYREVCVYCHTPHGANQAATAPLWNRTLKNTTFNTYNQLGTSTLTQTVRQPGGSSLTCLSCHDGQTAIDSIINMPGTWRNQVGQANQYTLSGITSATPGATQQTYYKLSAQFLNTWNNPTMSGRPTAVDTTNHAGLNSNMTQTSGKAIGPTMTSDGLGGFITYDIGCMGCHSPNGATQPGRTDFNMFVIGTDLRNDHPVGVTFPTTNGPGTDWKTPVNTPNNNGAKYFDRTDTGTIGKMDKSDIRIFAANKGGAVGAPSQTVECASCHDPHGVPDPSTGKFNPTFLRVKNDGSALCLTCHTK